MLILNCCLTIVEQLVVTQAISIRYLVMSSFRYRAPVPMYISSGMTSLDKTFSELLGGLTLKPQGAVYYPHYLVVEVVDMWIVHLNPD